MDYDSSSKFISSLAKFLQSLCNGYVEFDSGVHVIGHLYLSVDTGKTIDYILNEKVCKTDENSVTFISNSFHAQPAEKPKPPGKRPVKDSDKTDFKVESNSENYVGTQGEPKSTNVGTLPPARIANQNSPHSHGTKRPFSPSHTSQSKTGRVSPRHKKNRTDSLDQNTSQLANPSGESSVSSVPSPAADPGPPNISARNSDAPHGSQMNESYEQNYFQPDDENSLAEEPEERDIKPSIDTDVTFIKEEYGSSSSCSQSGSQSRDRTHGDETSAYPYQSNQVFPASYPGQGSFGASHRTNFNSSSSSHMFSPGQSVSKFDESSGDPSVQQMVKLEEIKHPQDVHDDPLVSSLFDMDQKTMKGQQDLKKIPPRWTERPRKFSCHFCMKSFVVKRDWEGHINSIHLKAKPFRCYICSWSSSHRGELQKHVKRCSQMYGHLTDISTAQHNQDPVSDDY